MGDFKVHQVRFFDYVPWPVNCMAYSSTLNKLAISRNVRFKDQTSQQRSTLMENLACGSIEIWSIDDNWFQERVFPAVSSVEALQWCGDRLFSGGMDEFLHEHDLQTGSIKSSAASNNRAIWCLTMNKEQTHIAAGTEAGCIVLFEITADGVEYYRAFTNLGRRILCIAWHDAQNVIVTGGSDCIRIWSVHSRQAISRIDTGRGADNLKTFVYTLCVTSDFTIISGDSRGYTSFWDGHHGTLIKSFRAHRGPVFAICVSDDGRKVLTSGVDPTMIQFELTSGDSGSGDGTDSKSTWALSTMRTKHSHDVRALISTGKHIISAGVDGRLVVYNVADGRPLSSAPIITSPLPQRPLVHSAAEANAILLQYTRRLELWKLGSTTEQSNEADRILRLSTEPLCKVSLVLRPGHVLHCSAISSSAQWIAYSDQNSLRLFSLAAQEEAETNNAPPTVLTRVRCLPPEGASPADGLCFTPDESRLVIARRDGSVHVWKLDVLQPVLVKVLEPPAHSGGVQPVLSLTVSSSGRYLAVCDVHRHIHIYQLSKLKYVCTLPTRSCQPTAVTFHPAEPLLLAVYADKMLMEFNLRELEYTSWSQQFSEHVPLSWMRRHNKVRTVFYHPRQPHHIYLADDEMFCIIDKTQDLPVKAVKLFRNPYSSKKPKSRAKHAFHICEQFKYVLHIDVLNDDSLVIVEQTPDTILQSLPPPLKRKHFGI